jgi:hypothetical protein
MAHRVFGIAPSDQQPVTFDVAGVLPNGEPWSERFTSVREIPSGVLDDLLATMSVDDQGRQTWNHVSLLRFMRGVLAAEDVARFEVLVRDKERIVPLDTLGELMMWLAEELTGRPTSRRSASQAGPPPTPITSRVDSSSPGSTRMASQPAAI